MSLAIEQPQPVPLTRDDAGVIRVGGTRVTLETVAAAFNHGATAEEIAQQYPTLSLADIYSVLGFLLRHPGEVSAYIEAREAHRSTVRQENQRRFDAQGVRARLLARGTPPAALP